MDLPVQALGLEPEPGSQALFPVPELPASELQEPVRALPQVRLAASELPREQRAGRRPSSQRLQPERLPRLSYVPG